MAQRRHHYERAFEELLRARRIPYVAVDEARKALLPAGAPLVVTVREGGEDRAASIKSFDFVLYGAGGQRRNLLVEVKGRKVGRPRRGGRGRLESWVTSEDVASLDRWERLFGEGFRAAFVFVYWCDEQPPDALFQDVFASRDRWYAVRVVGLREYAAAMTVRSERWGTVHLPAAEFERVSQPLTADGEGGALWEAPGAIGRRAGV